MAWPEYKQNMRGDPFTYIIGIQDRDGNTTEHVAGANNLFVANRAFEQLLFYYNEDCFVVLREGARVMSKEPGTGGWHREFLARTLGLNK